MLKAGKKVGSDWNDGHLHILYKAPVYLASTDVEKYQICARLWESWGLD